MSLEDGQPAHEGDVWFRLITNEKHIARGEIKHGAFKGSFLGVPDANKERSWANEISGRLRSLAGNVESVVDHAEKYCEDRKASGLKFAGLMFCRVRNVRTTFGDHSLDVVFTPLDDGINTDPHHADLVVNGKPILPDTPEHEQLLITLSDILKGLHHPHQTDMLPDAVSPKD